MTLDLKTFYAIGSGLFIVIILGNLYSFYLNFHLLNIGGRVSSIASILFNCLLLWLFIHLYKTTPSQKQNNDLMELVEELKNEDTKIKTSM